MTTAVPLSVIAFTPGQLPDSVPTAVYIARDSVDKILYVGVTGSLAARFAAHKDANLWWSSAAVIAVEMWPDRASAVAREAQLIAQFAPPHNRREKRQLGWVETRREREEVVIRLYEQGAPLKQICAELHIGYTQCADMVGRLRRDGRLERRPTRRRVNKSP